MDLSGVRRGERPTNLCFMARPPRIPVMLPWECKVIYFITICIASRCNGLANDAAWKAMCETLDRLNKWNTYCIVTMPDHIHLLIAPLDRELSVVAFLNALSAGSMSLMACMQNGNGSRVALIVFFERRNQFMKNGTIFERT
jgi:REP element-mobilizing transposase RayT